MTDERVRRERRRVKRLAAGLCAKCGKLLHRPGVQTCVSCFEKQKELDRKKYLRKAAEKKLERRESERPNTICIDCKHASPQRTANTAANGHDRSSRSPVGWL